MQQNTVRRPYNHCRYAGNNGDVWKHVILVEAVRRLAGHNPRSFHYVETHAGPGYARLGENGDWRRGIGRFMDGAGSRLDHPYFDLVLPAMNANFLYKGSWVLVAEYLRNVGHPDFKLTVHEVNADTLKMAGSAIRKGCLSSWIKLEPKSGYDALQKIEQANFVFIDPPYRSADGTADDWNKVMAAVERVKQLARHWMVWYPIFRREEPDALIGMSGGTSFEMTWAPDAPGWVMKGCGMLADEESSSLLMMQRELLASLADSLGGEISVRLATPKTKTSQNLRASHQLPAGSASYAELLGEPVNLFKRGMMLQ